MLILQQLGIEHSNNKTKVYERSEITCP